MTLWAKVYASTIYANSRADFGLGRLHVDPAQAADVVLAAFDKRFTATDNSSGKSLLEEVK